MPFRNVSNRAIAAINTALRTASPQGLSNVFQALRPNFSASEWLQSSNVYKNNCSVRIRTDLSLGGNVLSSGRDLADYIAASVPLHCSDGWTFLARALTSLSYGNPHQAAHFAYYAELRAAMSILASRGVGVFDNQHFVVNHLGDCVGPINPNIPTHKMAWIALDLWSNLPTSGSELLSLLNVAGRSVADWFSVLPGYSVANFMASQWLRDWGLDLGSVDTDHDTRNLASYRPTQFSAWSSDARDCSNFLLNLWSLFEPGSTRFELIDRHLLRILVRKSVLSLTAGAETRVTDMLDGLPFGDDLRDSLRTFLLNNELDPMLFIAASQVCNIGDQHVHEKVLSRAALLLRIASGFTAQIISQSTLAVRELDFWVGPWGSQRAFWNTGEEPPDALDLWLDVAVAMTDERAWMTNHGNEPVSMYEWRGGREQTIRVLTECDRASLWGLEP